MAAVYSAGERGDEHGTGDVLDAVETLIERYHGPLRDAEPTFGVLWAFAKTDDEGMPLGPPLERQGRIVPALIRITPYRDRVAGMPDVMLILCAATWEETPAVRRSALLDHLLARLSVALGDGGEVKQDDLGRPKLRMRHPDRVVEWFDAVARRYGADAVESVQTAEILDAARAVGISVEALAVGKAGAP